MAESAGAVGVPYLIQAVMSMRAPAAFTQTTIAYWELLLDRLWLPPGLAAKLAPFAESDATRPNLQLGLCGLGLAFATAAGVDDSLRSRVLATIERYGVERNSSLDDMLDQIRVYAASHDVFAELRDLAEARGPEHWLMP